MAKTRVGINGFGSIGRRFCRIAAERSDIEVVAINDLSDPATSAHLLRYDSNYGTWSHEVTAGEDYIAIDGRKVALTAIRDPKDIPWRDHGVDIVVESTGLFTKAEKARAHIEGGGAKKVIISAPAEGDDLTIVLGVNESEYRPDRHHILSNASCTTNCLAPVAKVLDETFGIEYGLMTTAHSYTNDQRILDLIHSDKRRARAAAVNIIPTSTGAAKAIHRVLPQLKGRMHGMALRVPTPVVSVIDLTFTARRPLSVEAINDAFRQAARGPLGRYLAVTDDPLVSSDFKGDPHSAIVDLPLTLVVGDRLGKVFAWYDNEWGYSNRLVELTAFVAEQGL
ncbi:MAG: type I glyceraldehyde-3-phosphate dehydrogenase [Actinomycetia bacterium]|nr:type I glyceraldehyde-3-phosphate dehydrogenase [Actinomycetes bacterium]